MQERRRPSLATRQPSMPSVIIRTLPLAFGNYGGVLQAYALQEYLRRLGADPVTDTPATFRVTTRTMARAAVSTLQGRGGEYLPPSIRNAANSQIHRFVEARIRTVDALEARGVRRRDVLDAASVSITGSDQVWRRAYGRVLPYLFADIARPDLRMLSFAASFGRGDLHEYSSRLIHESACLARRFHAVSVRETSGVEICRQHWGVAAEQHLDPVFLFDGDHYRELAGHGVESRIRKEERSVLAYVLDNSPAKSAFVEEAAARLGARPTSIRIPELPLRRAYRADPVAYLRPTVEDWIHDFVCADFVITDSFHGTALSILLNRPFISLVNHSRGAARFTSLLEVFDLADRLWSSPEEPLPSELLGPVDWESVNRVAERERERAGDYLTKNVLGPAPTCPAT